MKTQSYHNNIVKHPSDESGNEENSEDDESSDDDKSLKMEHFGNHMVMQSDINKNHHFYDQGSINSFIPGHILIML